MFIAFKSSTQNNLFNEAFFFNSNNFLFKRNVGSDNLLDIKFKQSVKIFVPFI